MEKNPVTLETIVSLAKRRGFIFPGSEIYGGLAGTFDYGPLGVALKKNIENLWWRMFVEERDDMYGIDAAILMNPKAWEASGHVAGFSDPLIECSKCNLRDRVDILYTRAKGGGVHILSSDPAEQRKALIDLAMPCPKGGAHEWTEPRQFNMMFKTHAGATDDDTSVVYLRPETAAGMFVNFKNVVDSLHPKLPFGLAQIGKAFRNEIAPREFIFRVRELEQMEVEYFVMPSAWEEAFELWRGKMHEFAKYIGLKDEELHELAVEGDDLAHYSTRTIDFEYDYPFGRRELWGLAYRTDFDLLAHQSASGTKLEYLDEETKEKITPHVIEPSLGVGRTLLAVLTSAYTEDKLGDDTRVYLALPAKIAPIKAMVAPLLKNKPELVAKAKEIREQLKKVHPAIAFDDNGNIGKRYRRQDEIGTPFCITIDFDTLGEDPKLLDTVTIRFRDTGEQQRMSVEEVADVIHKALA